MVCVSTVLPLNHKGANYADYVHSDGGQHIELVEITTERYLGFP